MRVEWIETRVPELQTVPDELWESVQARRVGRRCEARGNLRGRHPKYLFSGLLVCGECGSNLHYTHGPILCLLREHESGVGNLLQWQVRTQRPNRGSPTRSNLQEVFSPDTVAYLSKRVAEALTRLDAPDATRHRLQAELDQAWTRLENIKTAILEGIRTPTTKAMLEEWEKRVTELKSALELNGSRARRNLTILPSVIEGYLRDLKGTLGRDPDHARTLLATLVGPITLRREGDRVVAEVTGNLSGCWTWKPIGVNLVPGGRFPRPPPGPPPPPA